MEVYILDSQNRRRVVLDQFESLIWTDRWASFGEFEIVMPLTPANRNLFQNEQWLACNDSLHVMVVKNIEEYVEETGEKKLTISGRSLENVLNDRILWTSSNRYLIEGTPASIADKLFRDVCVSGIVSPNDILPFINQENLVPDPRSLDALKWRANGDLESTIKDGQYAIQVTENTSGDIINIDPNVGFSVGAGETLYISADVLVEQPMSAVRIRINTPSGALMSPDRAQLPEDGWVTHQFAFTPTASQTGVSRIFVWPNQSGGWPIGTRFWVRNFQVIPNYPKVMPTDTNPEPIDILELEIPPRNLYELTKDLCDSYDLGFRIIRDPIRGSLFFDIYSGVDRTRGQVTYPALVFSAERGNLQSSRSINTSYLYKNVAYVNSPIDRLVVFAPDIDTNVAGYERRVLLVEAQDITEEMSPDQRWRSMRQQGMSALMASRRVEMFDGEVSKNGFYQYGVDYNLGDLVEIDSGDGSASYMRVTEQILISDAEGDRSYPTLSMHNSVTIGSWLSWEGNETWSDMTDEVWEDM